MRIKVFKGFAKILEIKEYKIIDDKINLNPLFLIKEIKIN